ncbi:MAG: hypothetical protein HYZ53_17715 [Planctomycetes bacterium]|nr:hypothetical protein [Planctomycetota bacterium]
MDQSVSPGRRFGRRSRRAAACLALALGIGLGPLARAVRADIVYLTSGGRIEGKVLEEKDGVVRIQVRTGISTIPASQVDHIERKATPDEELAAARALLARDDADGRVKLAARAVEAGLPDLGVELLREALASKPGHAVALAALRRLLDPRAERLLTEAEAERRAGRLDAARGKLSALRRDAPEATCVPAARSALAELYLAEGRAAEAEREWTAALGSDGRGLDGFPGRAEPARRGLERAFAEQGTWEEAIRMARAVGDAGAPERIRAYQRLGETPEAGGGAAGRDLAGALERMRCLRKLGLAARALGVWTASPSLQGDAAFAREASWAAEESGNAALALDLLARSAHAGGGGAGVAAEDEARRSRLEALARYGRDFPLQAVGGADGLARLEKAVETYLSATDPAAPAAATALQEIESMHAPFAAVETVVRLGPGTRPAPFDGRTGLRRVPVTCPLGGGRTEYLLSIPVGYDPAKSWPLLISLHPTHATGDVQVYSWGRRLSTLDFLVACPTAERRIGFGHSRASESLVLAVAADVRRTFHVDPDRVFLEGMSMGAHMCWILGVAFPDRWAGIVPRSGSPLRVMDLIDNLFGVAVLSMNGDQDTMVSPEAPRKGCARLRDEGYDVTYREFAGRGHEHFADENERVVEWMQARRRNPYPRKVTFVTREEQYSRSCWVELAGLTSLRQTVLSVQGPDGDAIEQRTLLNTPGRVTGEIRGNEVLLSVSSNVREVTVQLADRLLDLDQPIVVRLDGAIRWQGKPARSVGHLLETSRQRGERDVLYANRVVLPVGGGK